MKWTYWLIFVSFVLYPVLPLSQRHILTFQLAHPSVFLLCGGLAPGSRQAPTQLLIHSCFPTCSRTVEKIWTTRARQFVGENKDSLIREGKMGEKKNSLTLTSVRQSTIKQQSLQKPLPPSSISLSNAEHDITWYGVSLCPIWIGCPGCLPSQPTSGFTGALLQSNSPPDAVLSTKRNLAPTQQDPVCSSMSPKGLCVALTSFNHCHCWHLRKGYEHMMGAADLPKGRFLCTSFV